MLDDVSLILCEIRFLHEIVRLKLGHTTGHFVAQGPVDQQIGTARAIEQARRVWKFPRQPGNERGEGGDACAAGEQHHIALS